VTRTSSGDPDAPSSAASSSWARAAIGGVVELVGTRVIDASGRDAEDGLAVPGEVGATCGRERGGGGEVRTVGAIGAGRDEDPGALPRGGWTSSVR